MAFGARAEGGDAFRPDIEGLRGLAILLVVLFHAQLIGVPGGFVGVDVFFVISGFLITGLLLRERERSGAIDLFRFYARRVRRLLPAAAVVLLVTLAGAHLLMPPLDRAEVELDGLAAALSVGNIRFAIAEGDYFAAVSTPSPFLHFWSLGVEEQFYFVWPALVLLAARFGRPRLGVGIVLLLLIAASLAASLIVTDIAANWAFYSLPTRAWQLALGGVLAVGAGVIARVPGLALAAVGWAGAFAVTVAGLVFTESMAYPGWAALLPTVGTAALIAAGEARFGPRVLLTLAPMRWLGRISYSLYLWHWPLLVLAPLALGVPELDLAARAALMLGAVAISTVSWAVIEEPFRRGFSWLNSRPRRTVAVGLASILLVSATAGNLSMLSVRAVESIGATDPGVAAAPDWEQQIDDQLDAAWEEWADSSPSSAPGQATGQPAPTDDPLMPTLAPLGPTAGPPDPITSNEPQPTLPPGATPPPPVGPTPAPSPDPTAPGEPEPPVDPGGNTLPADLTPPLHEARQNNEKAARDGCLVREAALEPRDCVYGEPGGAITVALVGDSHASAWLPAFEEIARHRGWRIVTFLKQNCPFIDLPVRHLILKREYTECATYNQAVIARLQSISPNLTVVSMSRWSVRPIGGSDAYPVADQAAAMDRFLDQVPGAKAILADTPYARIDIPSCLSAHPNDIRQCSFARSVAFAGDAAERERLAAQLSGAALVDVNHFICPGDGRCPPIVDSHIVLRDEHHLTAVMARWLARPLDAQLQPLL